MELRHGLALLLGASAALAPTPAFASPEWNAGWHTAYCATGADGAFFEESAWCNHVQADVLFLRERTTDLGLGPYAAVGTASFDDLRLESGLRALLPIHEVVPLTVSLGFVAVRDSASFEPGLGASLLVGPRSYNFHGSYSASGGLVLGVQRGLGAREGTTFSAGLAIDGMWLALPFIAVYQWVRGPPD